MVRDQDGRFDVIASARARSGNWLPIAGDAPFQLMLRLYDTTGSAAAGVMSRGTDALASQGGMSMKDRDLLMEWLPFALGALVLAGLVHIVSILAVPWLSSQDAWSRLARNGRGQQVR